MNRFISAHNTYTHRERSMDNLPPGFRFYPTEEELISFYLRNKLDGTGPDLDQVIPVIDIYSMDPWDLPQFSGERCHGDPEQWFFFTPRQAREARGGRPSRTTSSGYWKATGSPGYAYSSANRVIGMKKTMVFYRGKAPTGRKTEWKMNEYRAIVGEPSSSSSTNSAPNPILRHEYSLCRVYVGTGSLRAFDRRPSGVTTTSETEMQLQQASSSGAGPSSSHHQDSSSSGGDDANPPQIGENTDWEMTDDDFQSLLDWNNFNWDQHQT